MSKTLTLKKTYRPLYLFTGVLVICLLLTIPASVIAASIFPPGVPISPMGISSDTDTIHSIQVNKSLVSKKNKIRLFPDAKQQVLFFSANGEDRRVYQLYLFDMDGRLVSQASIRNRETTVLTSLSEGNYLFEVFTDDERIENGHLVVR